MLPVWTCAECGHDIFAPEERELLIHSLALNISCIEGKRGTHGLSRQLRDLFAVIAEELYDDWCARIEGDAE